jgi:hypothetical protein
MATTSTDPKVDRILAKLGRMKSVRLQYEGEWTEIRALVRPFGKDPTSISTVGVSKTLEIYDGTAPDALKKLASGFHSFVANPIERWFIFGVNSKTKDISEEVKVWLQDATDAVHKVYSTDASFFHTSMAEMMLDMPSFGTGYISQEWSPKIKSVRFRAHSTASCWIEEDWEGVINTLYREVAMTLDTVMDQFGNKAFTPEMLEAYAKDPYKPVTVIHAAEPRREYDTKKDDALNMPYSSCWVVAEYKHLLRESGSRQFPYHPARWEKLADEIYGRGPASTCLPDIRVLNAMERTILRASAKRVDPPILAPDDDSISPLSMAPGSINYIEDMTRIPVPFESGGDIQLGLEQSDQKRKFINECFHADWLMMGKNTTEMTATEVMDRRDEKLRLLAPNLGRFQAETSGPMVFRTLSLLIEHGVVTKPPAEIGELRELNIGYISPAAQAQTRGTSMILERFIQSVIPIGQINPKSLRRINWDNYIKIQGDLQNVPREALFSDEEVAAMDEKDKQTEDAATAAAIGADAGGAIKDIAQARATGMDLSSMLPAIGG